MSPEEAYNKLIEIGETEEAEEIIQQLNKKPGARPGNYGLSDIFGNKEKPWKYTEHAYGYIVDSEEVLLSILHPATIPAEKDLQGANINVSLDRLNVADYPGSGIHNILFDFYAENYINSSTEKIHFNILLKAYEGQSAAVINYPIFVGLNVGKNGLAFQCRTINVQNEEDEKFLGFLKSDEFKNGLQLINSIQPAIVPFSKMVQNVSESIAKRNRNIGVQDFFVGLDFSTTVTGLRLSTGSYIIAQIPKNLQDSWNWSQWKFDKVSGRIINKTDSTINFHFNYIIIGIKRFE
jgi:hypothetical protein